MSPASLPALLHYFPVSVLFCQVYSQIWLISFFCFKYISRLPVPLELGPNCLDAKDMPLLYCPHLQNLHHTQDPLMSFPELPTFILDTGSYECFLCWFFFTGWKWVPIDSVIRQEKAICQNSLDSRNLSTRWVQSLVWHTLLELIWGLQSPHFWVFNEVLLISLDPRTQISMNYQWGQHATYLWHFLYVAS